MRERAAVLFPFVIAVLFPPAGLVLGLAALESDRDLAARLIAVAVLAAGVWAFVLLA